MSTATEADLLAQSPDGPFFELIDVQLEARSWHGGRLVIRAQGADGRRAEGFVSIASYADIRRHAGPLGPRLFALLAGAGARGVAAAAGGPEHPAAARSAAVRQADRRDLPALQHQATKR